MADNTVPQANTKSDIDTARFAVNDPSEAFDKPEKLVPTFVKPTFGDDAIVEGEVKDGYFVPAGSVLPLGAGIPAGTVLKYGGYFPAGTSFPKGVLVPLHARLANILPAKDEVPPLEKEGMCLLQ